MREGLFYSSKVLREGLFLGEKNTLPTRARRRSGGLPRGSGHPLTQGTGYPPHTTSNYKSYDK